MKKHNNLVRGLTGALSVSALALGLAGTAQAAPYGGLTVEDGSGVQGKLLIGRTSTGNSGDSLTTLVYNSTNGGNGSGIGGTGSGTHAGAGPFAPAVSTNITFSRHNLGSGNMIDSNHTNAVLATNTKGGDNAVVGTNQICVFCHTPHGFNAVTSGPLWNKQVNSSAAYTVYNAGSNNSSTLDADAPVIGSVSLACLSCHDGTQAMDNMINAPGSGGMAKQFDASLSSGVASTVSGTTNSTGVTQGYIWGTSAGGFAIMGQGGTGASGFADPGNGDVPAQEGIDLGLDLSNDHPISVQYCGGGILSTGTASGANFSGSNGQLVGLAQGTCADRLFNLPTTQTMGGQQRFWVDTNVIPDADAIDAGAASTGGLGGNPITRDPETVEIYVTNNTTLATDNPTAYANRGDKPSSAVQANSCGTGANGDNCGRGFVSALKGASAVGGAYAIAGFGIRTKQDIMLFTNNAGVTGPSVECASCHDPHTPNNGTFLRVSNNQSGLCLSCHVK